MQRRAILYGLLAVLCWSTIATALKIALQYLTPWQMVGLAAVTSWLFFVAILIARGQFLLLFQQSKSVYAKAGVLGCINPGVYYFVLFSAYQHLPAQEAQAINYTWAITLSLMAALFLGQKLRKYDLIAAAICYFGVLIIATRGEVFSLQFSSAKGVALALASTVLWALYWILNRKNQIEPVLALCLNFTFALPLLFLVLFVSGGFAPIAWQGLAAGVYIGVFEMGISFVLWAYALQITDSTAKIANLIFLSPLLSLLFIATILGEAIFPSTGIALGCIVLGLVIQQCWQK